MSYLAYFVNSNPAAETPAFQWFKDTGNLALGEGSTGAVTLFSTPDDCHTATSAMDLYTKLHAILGDFYPYVDGRESPASPVGIFAISDSAKATITKAIGKKNLRRSAVRLPDDTVIDAYLSTGGAPFLHIPVEFCTELLTYFGYVDGYARLVTEEEKADGIVLRDSGGTDWRENVTLFLGENGGYPGGFSNERTAESKHTQLRCVMGTWTLVPDRYRWTGEYWVFLPGACRGGMAIGFKESEGVKRDRPHRTRVRPELADRAAGVPQPAPVTPPPADVPAGYAYEPITFPTGVGVDRDWAAPVTAIETRYAELQAQQNRAEAAVDAAQNQTLTTLNPLGGLGALRAIPATIMGGAGAATLGALRDNPF